MTATDTRPVVAVTPEQVAALRVSALIWGGDSRDVEKHANDSEFGDAWRVLRRWEQAVAFLEMLDAGEIVVDDRIVALLDGLEADLVDAATYLYVQTRDWRERDRREALDEVAAGLEAISACRAARVGESASADCATGAPGSARQRDAAAPGRSLGGRS